MKTPRIWFWLLLIALLGGCGGEPSPVVPMPTEALVPTATPTPDLGIPENVGRAFLTAWAAEDYAQMYTLLAPTLRGNLSQESFEQVHRTALQTTTTLSMTLTPQTLSITGEATWIDFEEQWHTTLFGTLRATNRLDLVQEDGQWWVNWNRGTLWPDLAGGNRFAVEYQIPPRANIYDYTGAGLATQSIIVTVGVIPGQIQDHNAVLGAISWVLGRSTDSIYAAYANQPDNWYIPIGDTTGEIAQLYEAQLSQPGIELRERVGRAYPEDGIGAHVVGWVSPIPVDQLATYQRRGYRSDAWVGIAGIEAWGESYLAGSNGGLLYLIDAEGNYLRKIAERQAQRGRALYLTLDRDLQQAAEQVLGDRRGAIVALDVRTGAVRALASGPHYNNNIFIRPSDSWTLQAVLNDPQRPLFNRATQGLYPTGSVFKIVTMAAGLEAGEISPQAGFSCPGYWDGLGSLNRKTCWLETGHGALSFYDGLVGSCNVVFYQVGAHLHSLDPDILPTYGRAFGLGTRTGLVTLNEAEGLMPDDAWKYATYREHWTMGDTVNLAIGQGYLLTTPLQVAQMMAAIANGGTRYSPYLIDRIAASGGQPEQFTNPVAQGQLPISADTLATLQAALRDVTRAPNGTATHRFQGLGIPVAGKTGTAEVGAGAEPHSWFAGYFPADNPEIALVVMVENAGEGSTVAAPMFRQVIEAYHGLPLTPLPTPTEDAPQGD